MRISSIRVLKAMVQWPAHRPPLVCQSFTMDLELLGIVIKLKIDRRNLTDWGRLMCWPLYLITENM